MADRPISNVRTKPDAALETTRRPAVFDAFTGQAKVREHLETVVQAAKQRGKAIDHVLLSGPTIEKAGDLAGLLTNLDEGDGLFIDEILRLKKTIEPFQQWAHNSNMRAPIGGDCTSPAERQHKITEIFGRVVPVMATAPDEPALAPGPVST